MYLQTCLQVKLEMNREDKAEILESAEAALREAEEVLESRLAKIIEVDKKRVGAEKIFEENPNLLLEQNSKLKEIVTGTYRENRGNPLLFVRGLRVKRAWVQNLRGETSYAVLKHLNRTPAEFGDERFFGTLIDLFMMAGEAAGERDRAEGQGAFDAERVVQFIKTESNRNGILAALQHIKNRKAAERIRKAILELTNEEMEYLVRYENQAHSWHSREVVTEDMPFFISKANLFLYGQTEDYKGLLSYFKDDRMKDLMSSNAALLQFRRYQRQLAYLAGLRNRISTYRSGNWEQFNEFYRKIRKTADTLADYFGNQEMASELLRKKDIIGEYPEKWEEYLNAKILELSSVAYRKRMIIEFIKGMEGIFSLRMGELRASKGSEIPNLMDSLRPLVTMEKKTASSILNEIRESGRRAGKRNQKLREDFEILSNRCVDELLGYVQEKQRLIDHGIIGGLNSMLRKALRQSNEELRLMASASATSVVERLYTFARLSRITAAIGADERDMVSMPAKKDSLGMISQLSLRMRDLEEVYAELDKFISGELGLLIIESPEPEKEAIDYGRRRAA